MVGIKQIMTKSPQTDWREEFYENVQYDEAEVGCNWSQDELWKQIELHTSQVLTQQREEIVGYVDKMLSDANVYQYINPDDANPRRTYNYGRAIGWNDALVQLRQKLTSLKDENNGLKEKK